MQRSIDALPSPPKDGVRRMKVVGLSTCRTGTIGLYRAFKILGYHPFHMAEVCRGGVRSMRIFREGIMANNDVSGSITPYGRTELDKWLAEYDCAFEVPSLIGAEEFVKAYIDDPDVKFILTERSPESFARSFVASIGEFVAEMNRPPLSVLQYFDAFNREFFRLNNAISSACSGGLPPDHPGYREELMRNFEQYIAKAKQLVPEDRLLVLSLDKGFGWEEICSFLDLEIPDTPYPRSNDAKEFRVKSRGVIRPGVGRAVKKLSIYATVLLTAGTGAYIFYNKAFGYLISAR